MKNWLLRSLTGAVYVVLTVSGILFGVYTFLCLFAAISVLCLWEFYGLMITQKQIRINSWFNCFGGLLLFVCSYLYAKGAFSYVIFFPYLLYVVIVFITELYEKHSDPLTHAAFIFLGQCYIALPFSLLNLLAFSGNDAEVATYSPVLILALFVFIWTNDTFAFVTGSLLGKHRLFERISPKKSWEGFAGGLLFTVVAALLFARFDATIPYYHWMGLAVVVVVFGTFGDLAESLIKRTLSVKDSGKMLPGHGGFLDRFDSLLLAVYGMLFYVQLFIQN